MTPELLRQLIKNSEEYRSVIGKLLDQYWEPNNESQHHQNILAANRAHMERLGATIREARKVLLALESAPNEEKKFDNITGSFV